MIFFQVDCIVYSVGTGDFLNSFFSTVTVKLEQSVWGSRFPIIMRELYSGRLPKDQVKTAQEELDLIEAGLTQLPPSEIIWDFEDLSARPPWGDEISPDIRHMADYFVTSDGQNLLTVMKKAFQTALELDEDVLILSL